MYLHSINELWKRTEAIHPPLHFPFLSVTKIIIGEIATLKSGVSKPFKLWGGGGNVTKPKKGFFLCVTRNGLKH